MNVYGRVSDDRLSEAVERVGSIFLQPKGVPAEHQTGKAKNEIGATHIQSLGCADENAVRNSSLDRPGSSGGGSEGGGQTTDSMPEVPLCERMAGSGLQIPFEPLRKVFRLKRDA